MGHPRIAHKKKVESVSYCLLGLTMAEAARRAGTEAKSVWRWTVNDQIVREAKQLIELAKQRIAVERGQIVIVGKRRYSAASYAKMQENGRRRAAQIAALPEEERRSLISKMVAARHKAKSN